MICCIQRVSEASVTVDENIKGEIKDGLVVLFGVEKGDDYSFIDWMAEKVANLRIFQDDSGKMSRSIINTGGSVLIISQFTLAGNCSKGRRPDFTGAESPKIAEEFYNKFIFAIRNILGEERVASGVFGAHMEVALINDGPVTLILEKNND